MIDYEIIPKFWKINKMALIPWVFTFVISFVLGIEYGILIGIGVHLLLLLYPMARPAVTMEYLECVVVTFRSNITYPSSDYLQEKVLKGMGHESGDAKSVVLDCTYLTSAFDFTCLQAVGELIADFKLNGVHFALACVVPEIKNDLILADMADIIFADSVEEAIREVKALSKKEESEELEAITINKEGLKAINGSPIGSPRTRSRLNQSPLPGAYNAGFEYDKPSERL